MAPTTTRKLHGDGGVFRAGKWVAIQDLEDLVASPQSPRSLPRIRSTGINQQAQARKNNIGADADDFDVCVIGAGCVGSAVARELAKTLCRVVLLEAADDVTQGATKGNSGIVHAGFDDKPGSVRAKFCWPGNQMFPALDKELNFGFDQNGSLVVATNEKEVAILDELLERGRQNGVENLRIVHRDELFEMEPNLNPNCIAALYSPDAGTLTPYEFTIALAENAVDNGVELRLRSKVVGIEPDASSKAGGFLVTTQRWETQEFLAANPSAAPATGIAAGAAGAAASLAAAARRTMGPIVPGSTMGNAAVVALPLLILCVAAYVSPAWVLHVAGWVGVAPSDGAYVLTFAVLGNLALIAGTLLTKAFWQDASNDPVVSTTAKASGAADVSGAPKAPGQGESFTFSPSPGTVLNGRVVSTDTLRARYVVNCAGCQSDEVAALIGDGDLFKVKPRLGEYILLKKEEGKHITRTLFPAPDPVKGKGVLVQNTLWGNLILGPTARDTLRPVVGAPGKYEVDPAVRDESPDSIMTYILAQCQKLVPGFDASQVIHTFAGARAKTTRGDWVIEPSTRAPHFIHAAGIDSPGIAASPAIALEVCRLLRASGLQTNPDPAFNPIRRRLFKPKNGFRGLKMRKPDPDVSSLISGPGNDIDPATNVICKCEKVTEAEVIESCRRSLPCDSTQAIRKRCRAGMGHCQSDPKNYGCEDRVAAIIARELGVANAQVGRRPWPASSVFPQRIIDDTYRQKVRQLAHDAKEAIL